MGNYSSNKPSSLAKDINSLALDKNEANSPEIYPSEILVLPKNEKAKLSNIISELLNSETTLLDKNKCPHQKNNEYSLSMQKDNVLSPVFPPRTKDSKDTITSDNEHFEIYIPTRNKLNLTSDSDDELDKEDILIVEEIKTMPGSLEKDIKDIYKLKDYLGGGHFGSVRTGFRRLEPEPKRLYAIKSLPTQHLSAETIEELMTELDIISSLDHPNIIKFYETYQDKYFFHIVMEFCKGKDLGKRIKENNGVINEKNTVIAIMKVLHAINYCHSKGITHRDLKPDNIILESNDPNAEIKLIDFGLSKKYLKNEKMHTILGTPYYIAPEVLKGNYDEKCDIWSIGAMTYMMLCGEPPFTGKNNNAIFQKIIKQEVKFTNPEWKNISAEAKDFIMKCLNKNPELRPSAVNALTHEWFNCILSKMHSSMFLSKEILLNIKSNNPRPKFKKLVMKYFINMMTHQNLKPYKLAFFAVNFNHNGCIEGKDLEKAFKLGGVEVNNDEIKKIISYTDENNKNELSYTDFIIACLNKDFITNEKLLMAFQYFDIDYNGVIDALDIKASMLRFGKKMLNEEDVFKIIREVTKKDKDTISFEEFCSMFKLGTN